MELKIKLAKWSAGVPVAMLNTKTAEKIGAHLLDRDFKTGARFTSARARMFTKAWLSATPPKAWR